MEDMLQFLADEGMQMNEFNVYSYVSKDGTQMVNLVDLLDNYKEYLIDKLKN